MLFSVFFVACSSSKQNVQREDPVYDGLTIGMTKQDVISVLGKDYKFDMNNVTQTQNNYVETLIWSSSDPNVAYVLTFVNNSLSRKTRERVVKDVDGNNIQLPR